jgi:uncharacterized protein involved in response to NO
VISRAEAPDNPRSIAALLRLHPYRLFFPLGAVAGVLGVGQWLFWSIGWHVPAVSLTHTTIQAQGFLACFVLGFLFTAFPRFTGAPPAPLAAIVTSVVAMGAFLVFAMARSFAAAEIAFLTALAGLGTAMARSLLRRTKPLTGPFILVGFGLAHAVVGSVLILVSGVGERSTVMFGVGRQMVQLGFLLCAVLGVTGKLAPFLMGYGGLDPCDTPIERLRNSPLSLVVHALTGLIIAASFVVEPTAPRAATAARALVVTAHMALFARFARLPARRETYRIFFSVSTWLVATGLCLEALFPIYRVAALHVTFIGGFSLMIFSFGSLVVLSHSARAADIAGPMRPLWWVGGAVLVAMVFRVSADLTSNRYMGLIHAASGTWVLAALGWLSYSLCRMRGNPAHSMEPPA